MCYYYNSLQRKKNLVVSDSGHACARCPSVVCRVSAAAAASAASIVADSAEHLAVTSLMHQNPAAAAARSSKEVLIAKMIARG